jgi:hypothetical protein
MKKTITGMVIMAVAIILTLSGAVFAANSINVVAPSEDKKVGEAVTVTVNYPANTVGRQYTVTYNKDVLSTTEDPNGTGSFVVALAGQNNDLNPVSSDTLTFTAKANGTSNITLSNIKLADPSNNKIDGVTANTAKVTVAETKAPETTTTPAPTTTPETKIEATTAPTTTATTENKDKTVTKTKDVKAGFDGMLVIALFASIVLAGGIVTVSKRK